MHSPSVGWSRFARMNKRKETVLDWRYGAFISVTQTRMFGLHTLSPTHVGIGRGLGYIDLPIQRDKVTEWPFIPGSAFKGVWRDWTRTQAEQASEPSLKSGNGSKDASPNLVALAFGRASDREPSDSNADALIPSDARIVCLPVRSFHGTFAWCTSPWRCSGSIGICAWRE